ncbi:hypothetical protein AB6A40_004078 [Gnathostoma spinigerum]|uniref:EF-hand domain-containing protein n=1 Tax=Gnathostoma spinigerum TaxID=75299 RepID=A0ABD6EBD8_9BILA
MSLLCFILVSLLPRVIAIPLRFPITSEFGDPDNMLPEETIEEKFARSDANHDGKLTFDEFLHIERLYEQIMWDEFTEYDQNKDGVVSRDEYEGRLSAQAEKISDEKAKYFGRIYEDFDEDFDLELNPTEVQNILRQRFLLETRSNFPEIFAAFDEDQSGGLSIGEYIKFDANIPFYEMDPVRMSTTIPKMNAKSEKLPGMKPLKMVKQN